MNSSNPDDRSDQVSKEDSELILESLLWMFSRVPQRPPLQSALKKLHPSKLGIGDADFFYCKGRYEMCCAEISHMIAVYLAALKSADSQPDAPFLALSCLSHFICDGPKAYNRWIKEPNAGFGGLSPVAWAEARDLTELARYLFDSR
jgi:hypothetical protein